MSPTRLPGTATFRTAASAYRTDTRARRADQPFGPDDGLWLQSVSLLQEAVRTPAAVDGAALQHACTAARQSLGPALARGVPTDPAATECATLLPLRLLAEEMEEAGALHLAGGALESLLATGLLGDVESGRVAAQCARIAWKRGELERSATLYRAVERIARATKSHELRVRGLIGRAVLAQLRGNMPDVYRWAGQAVRLSERHRLPMLARIARTALMAADARAGRFDSALQHAWLNYRSAQGNHVEESTVLGNMGQLLLDLGRPDTARAAFSALFVRSASPRMIVPALGGFALASAACGEAADLTWAVREIRRAIEGGGAPYDVAVASLEAATALASLGRDDEAGAMRADAAAIADRHGYHEIAHRVQVTPAMEPRAETSTAPSMFTDIEHEMRRLRPDRLPAAVLGAGVRP